MKNINAPDSPDKNEESGRKKIIIIQRTGAAVFLALIAAAFIFAYVKYGSNLYNMFCNTEHLKKFLARFNGYDQWIFVLIRAFQTVIKIIPAEPLEIASGFLYGTWKGFLFCMLGTEIGSLIIIVLTKLFGRKIVNLFVSVEKIDSIKILNDKAKLYFSLFIIFLIPGTPKDILTYAAGITKINIPLFLLITGIARIPSIITSTWCGQEIIEKNYLKAIIIFAAVAASAAVGAIMYKKYINNKSVNESK